MTEFVQIVQSLAFSREPLSGDDSGGFSVLPLIVRHSGDAIELIAGVDF
jgi:hypothetical protein